MEKIEIKDFVFIISGALKGHEGKIVKIDDEKKVVTVSIDMFGRATDIKVEMECVKKIR